MHTTTVNAETGTTEHAYTDETAARDARRQHVRDGRRVSLMVGVYRNGRDVYVFDVYGSPGATETPAPREIPLTLSEHSALTQTPESAQAYADAQTLRAVDSITGATVSPGSEIESASGQIWLYQGPVSAAGAGTDGRVDVLAYAGSERRTMEASTVGLRVIVPCAADWHGQACVYAIGHIGPHSARVFGQPVAWRNRADALPADETPESESYPRRDANGGLYWACCVSSIGPVCQHRETPESEHETRVQSFLAGMRTDDARKRDRGSVSLVPALVFALVLTSLVLGVAIYAGVRTYGTPGETLNGGVTFGSCGVEIWGTPGPFCGATD